MATKFRGKLNVAITRRVSRGSVSRPSDPKSFQGTRLAQDATPYTLSRGTVSHPSH